MAGIWIGTSGFSYKEWRPLFYPAELPERKFLRYYASQFNSVEIDSTFYRMPTARTIDAWKSSTGDDFRFALKASQQITHRERLRIPSRSLDYLLQVVSGLDSRLGLILYQLPPYFKCDVPKLKAFLGALPRGMRSAFEFRHASWQQSETYEALRRSGSALCIHDTDDDTTPVEVTAPFTIVRLRRSQYDASLRELWQRRIRAWAADGVDVFAYIKHEDNPDAPGIAREFVGDLNEVNRAR